MEKTNEQIQRDADAEALKAAQRNANTKATAAKTGKADPNDDDEWVSTPGADKGRFIVKSLIRGKVQGRSLKLGTTAELELTDDIADLIRPGVLEPVESMGES